MPGIEAKIAKSKQYKETLKNPVFKEFSTYMNQMDAYATENKAAEKNTEKDAVQDNVIAEKKMNIRPEGLSDVRHYMQLKESVKNVYSSTMKTIDIQHATEWAMGSAMVDGASPGFMNLVHKMMEYCKVEKETTVRLAQINAELSALDKTAPDYNEKSSALNSTVTTLSLKKMNKAYELMAPARDYLNSHKGWRLHESGKLRKQLAQSILDIVDGHPKYKKSRNYDADSEYIRNYMKRAYAVSMQRLHNAYQKNDVYKKFDAKDNICLARYQIRSYYSWDINNTAVQEADREDMEKALQEALDGKKAHLFSRMDRQLKELMAYTISDKFYSRSWVVSHPDEIIRFFAMATRCGDEFYKEPGIMAKTAGEYMQLLKQNNPGLYKAVSDKTKVLFEVWTHYCNYMQRIFGIDPLIVSDSTLSFNLSKETEFAKDATKEYLDEIKVLQPDEYRQYKLTTYDKMMDYEYDLASHKVLGKDGKPILDEEATKKLTAQIKQQQNVYVMEHDFTKKQLSDILTKPTIINYRTQIPDTGNVNA